MDDGLPPKPIPVVLKGEMDESDDATESSFALELSAHEFESPLPRPEHLRQYEELVPGAAERILTMVEDEAKHGREMDKLQQEDGRRFTARGQWLAITAVLSTMSVATFAIYRDAPWAGVFLGGVALASIVTVFVTGRHDGKYGGEPNDVD